MRILQISSSKEFGEHEKQMLELSKGLQELGHEVFFGVHPENEFEERLSFIPADLRIAFSTARSFNLFSAQRISNLLRDKNIQVVHAHRTRDYLRAGIAVRLYGNARLVITRHTADPINRIRRIILGNVSKAIAVSSAVEASLGGVLSRDAITAIPEALETGGFDPEQRIQQAHKFVADHGLNRAEHIIGTIGELDVENGQEDFVLAAAEVRKQFPGSHFVVIGTDRSMNQSFRRKLKRLVKILEMEDSFLFLDWIEDLEPAISAMDIYVSPVKTGSAGLTIAEAMSLGTPVVATSTGDAFNLVEDGETGLLSPAGDPVELAACACRLLQDKNYADRIAGNARNKAEEEFSLSKIAKSTEAVYRELISSD